LLKEGFLKLEDGMYRLTDTGIAMHDSVCWSEIDVEWG
jgi:hypothetical protein